MQGTDLNVKWCAFQLAGPGLDPEEKLAEGIGGMNLSLPYICPINSFRGAGEPHEQKSPW